MNARVGSPSVSLAPPALYEQVAERLRSRIFSHELEPGAWIDEQAIASAYGISRTPLREALKVLASEGLVTLKPRRGCYVTELSEQDLDEIFPLMALLEGRCAFEATQKAKPADIKRLKAIHAELEKQAATGDADRFFEANQEFHLALQQLAGNRWLAQMIEDLRKVMKLRRRDSLRLEGRIADSLSEHRSVLEACAARDAKTAEKRMRAHLLSGRTALAKLQGAV
jgi:DNA-binding GntR family transcriptional regulator